MISPALRLSAGVVSLLTCALVVADIFFGVFPDPHAGVQAQRTRTAEVATAYVAQQLSTADHRTVEAGLDAVRQRDPDILAVVVRNSAGELIARSGAVPQPGASDEVRVGIQSAQGEWGHARFHFASATASGPLPWLADRRIWVLMALGTVFVSMTYLYLRRALLYLDPMSVVPERLRTAFDSLTEGIALLDPKHRVVMGNKALRDMVLTADSKLLGRRLEDAAQLQIDGNPAQAPWQRVMETGQAVRAVRVHVGSGESRRTGSLNCSPIIDGLGKVRGCLVTLADVTEIERSNGQLRAALTEIETAQQRIEAQNEELKRLASVDGLTGLMNRRAFFQDATAIAERHAASGTGVAVLMMDVDHFKSVNDRFGHATGDAVLQRVARCLGETVRFNDLAARYGGEEFCVLVESLDQAGVLVLAERIRHAIEHEAKVALADDQLLTVTVSIGVAMSSPEILELSELVKSADTALYASKHGGRNRVTLAQGAASGLSRKQDAGVAAVA